MSEISETGNFLQTETAQKKHAKAFVEERGILEKIQGRASAYPESWYQKGRGGSVETRLEYGDAWMTKRFDFNQKGELEAVHVWKAKRGIDGGINDAYILTLKKDHLTGEFKIVNRKVTPFLNEWEKKFKDIVANPVSKK